VAIELGRLAPGLAERRLAIMQGAIDQAQILASAGRIKAAYQIAHALASLTVVGDNQVPSSRFVGEGRRLIRDLLIDVREGIGEAHAAGDARAVVRLGEGAGDLLREDSKSATLVARSQQALGDAEAGLDLLKRLNPNGSRNVLVRRWTARLAHGVRDYATALEMYGSLRDEGGSEVEKFRAEIDRFFGIAEARSLKALTLLARAGNYDEALRLAQSITRYIGRQERADRELARMHRMLRIRLKQIQEGDGELEEREPVLRRMVQIIPDDGSTLRRLALELMRQFRFAEAAECWERLYALDPGNESADRNRVRCTTLAKRRATASAQVFDIA
jgi:tetratricopeptide (TPR) repeat protein